MSVAGGEIVASATKRREERERAVEVAHRELDAILAATAERRESDARALARARLAVAKAHAARAEGARHGAGQISLSAQRAPTREDCDLGWLRASEIVAASEASARVARAMATALEEESPRSGAAREARAVAARAEAAARDARRILEERNDAYTFHVDGGFSFGEGWHVAAAAVLGGVAVQIEPGKPATPHAERFLREAGLPSDQLRPYRPRPRAMKQTTEIVARAFREDPTVAQRRLRVAFLGEAPVAPAVVEYADAKLARAPEGHEVLLWVRAGRHAPGRNTTRSELAELVRLARDAGLVPVLMGDAVPGDVPEGAVDMTLHWQQPAFSGEHGRRAQLQLFEHLRRRHGVVGQLGVTTAGMDGPALMGMPTAYLTDAPNVRMRRWVGAVPGYEEIVRDGDYLARVRAVLLAWASAP